MYRADNSSGTSIEETPPEMTIRFEVGDISSPVKSHNNKMIYRTGDEVHYERQVGKLATMKLRFSCGKVPTLRLNNTYYRWGRLNVGTVRAAGRLLQDILQITLLENGYSQLYAGSFSVGDQTVIIFGLPNAGKTTTTFNYVEGGGTKYISEDLTVTDGENLYICPYIKPDSDIQKTERRSYKLYRKLREAIPLLESVYDSPLPVITDMIPEKSVATDKEVTDIFLLSHHDNKNVQVLPDTDAFQRILASNRARFAHQSNRILLAAQYVGLDINTEHLLQQERDIINKLIDGANIRYITGYYSHFQKAIDEELCV